jgi:hypothetical protein
VLIKQSQFFGQTESGIFCQPVFGNSGLFEKVAGAPSYVDWDTGEELHRFLKGITAADRKAACFVLVNALGAGEYYGSNINSDLFPWNALAHEGLDYGHKTFLNAHAFMHHKNKDPTRAFGQPVESLLNPRMKRVELIVRLDREKAKTEGADGVIVRIDAGEFPDVSMGAKVPFDICSICGHKSKTKSDYCVHMRPPEHLRHIYGPNKILPNGQKICVINTLPRFFDISFVFIGADKTAKTMAKLASVEDDNYFSRICATPRLSVDVAELSAQAQQQLATSRSYEVLTKTAGVKTSAHNKISEMIKTVPAGVFASRCLPELVKRETDIPSDILDRIASKGGVGECCSSAGALGIVLKPHEFQRIVLMKMGRSGLAHELDGRRLVFNPSSQIDHSFPVDPALHAKEDILNLLKRFIGERSFFGEPLRVRTLKITVSETLPTRNHVEHPLLDKISSAYNGYRKSYLDKLASTTEMVRNNSDLKAYLLGCSSPNNLHKTASDSLLTEDAISYVLGAFLSDKTKLSSNS